MVLQALSSDAGSEPVDTNSDESETIWTAMKANAGPKQQPAAKRRRLMKQPARHAPAATPDAAGRKLPRKAKPGTPASLRQAAAAQLRKAGKSPAGVEVPGVTRPSQGAAREAAGEAA